MVYPGSAGQNLLLLQVGFPQYFELPVLMVLRHILGHNQLDLSNQCLFTKM